MPERPLDYFTPRQQPADSERRPQYLEIQLGRNKRLAGLIGYVALFAAVATVLVWMFKWFTSSLWLAVGVVLFLVSYMLLMGWWASRNLEGPDR
jgi:hypothetical protein